MRVEDQETGTVEILALTDKTTPALEATKDGKIRVGLSTKTDTVVILKDQVLEVRNVNGTLRLARKVRRYDEKDPYVPPYDCYGPGEADEIIEDAPVIDNA